MITQERAQQIMEQAASAQGSSLSEQVQHTLTPEEDAQVRQHWSALPSSASYMDAFYNFLNGTTGEQG